MSRVTLSGPHGYFELNLTIIWDTVTTYLDKLSQQIAAIK